MLSQTIDNISINTNGPIILEITDIIENWITINKCYKGILHLYIMHTSASLLIQENADPSVLKDLLEFYKNLAPIADNYKHKTEGPDDMPAHIKSSLTNTSLTLSIQNEGLILGTWQGIYLFEHRWKRHLRKLNLHFIGEKS